MNKIHESSYWKMEKRTWWSSQRFLLTPSTSMSQSQTRHKLQWAGLMAGATPGPLSNVHHPAHIMAASRLQEQKDALTQNECWSLLSGASLQEQGQPVGQTHFWWRSQMYGKRTNITILLKLFPYFFLPAFFLSFFLLCTGFLSFFFSFYILSFASSYPWNKNWIYLNVHETL